MCRLPVRVSLSYREQHARFHSSLTSPLTSPVLSHVLLSPKLEHQTCFHFRRMRPPFSMPKIRSSHRACHSLTGVNKPADARIHIVSGGEGKRRRAKGSGGPEHTRRTGLATPLFVDTFRRHLRVCEVCNVSRPFLRIWCLPNTSLAKLVSPGSVW